MKGRSLLLLLSLGTADGKGPCQNYFGTAVTTGVTTVVDPDITAGFPSTMGTFVHHVGDPSTLCVSPGPPGGCHRYYVASYDMKACPASCPLKAGSGAPVAGKLDVNDAFDRANGLLKECAACAKNVTIACWHAPADEPVRCSCPGSEWRAAPAADAPTLLAVQPAPRAAGVAWGSVLANQVAAVMIVFGVFATVTMFGIVYARSRVQKDAPAADTPAAAGRRAGGDARGLFFSVGVL